MNHSQFKISILSEDKFKNLAKYRDFYCISIFIPSIMKGKNPLERVESILMERFNKGIRSARGIDYNLIQDHLRDIRSIVVEWKSSETQDNIVLYLSNALIEAFFVEKSIPFKVYLNDHFYLKFFAQKFNSTNTPFREYLKDKKLEKILLEDINEIIKLSAKGEIRALLLEKGNDLFGELDEENDFVLPMKEENSGTSLSNIAAIHTILNKGNVFIIEKGNMPIPEKPINAIIKK